MKYFLYLLFFVLVSSSFLTGEGKSTSKDVAMHFLQALNAMEFEEAKKYASPETDKMLDMLSSFSGFIPDSLNEQSRARVLEIKDVKEMGDKCKVIYTSGGAGSEEISLIKTNGEWLVHMSKDEMGMGAKGSQEE